MATIQHLGCAGHFIASRDCGWRRHSQIDGRHGSFRVSTVGNYYTRDGQRQPLGCDRGLFFETMVFRTTGKDDPDANGCDCRLVEEWTEIDSQRYATAGEAQAGHDRFVSRYAARADNLPESGAAADYDPASPNYRAFNGD